MPVPSARLRLITTLTGAVVAASVLTSAWSTVIDAPQSVVKASAQRFVESDLWLAPQTDLIGGSDLAIGVQLLSEDRAADAVSFLARELEDPLLGAYARLHIGRAQVVSRRFEDAAASARQIIKSAPGGALGVAAVWLLAQALEGGGAWAEAVPVWQTATGLVSSRTAEAYLRLAVAAEKVNDATLAQGAYSKIYYDYPLSAEAEAAGRALARPGASPSGPDRARLELGRAEKLFAARRFADARKAYDGLRQRAPAEERRPFDLRLAQCDFHLSRYAAARDGLHGILGQPVKSVEAEFIWLGTLRGLKRDAEYLDAVPRFVAANPASPWAEAALNDLATYYILSNDDGRAASVFTDLFARFPAGAYADRAAWKAGWWAYKHGNRRETIRVFEAAAVAMRRADYRPSWLYWAAKAHEELGEREAALAGYRQTVVFYRNSYYGREATRAIARLSPARVAVAANPNARGAALVIAPGGAPANASVIRALLVAGLYDDAIAELRQLQLVSGTSPVLEATIAYALNRKGELRPGITAMRRAYPQFMAEGGEELPRRLLGVIFPVAHWDLIRRYAANRQIDVFLLTALVAQESTFQADVRSSADAWGLMQLIPSTGRRYATKTGAGGFSTARLTDPEYNVRLGTAYLSDLLAQFGDVAQALAAYNAGEGRVIRWRAERPGVTRDEFVDDIPFPETQNYVKRIIGTAEDYRILYGPLPEAAVRQTAR